MKWFLTSSRLVRSTMCCRTWGCRKQTVLGTKEIGMEDAMWACMVVEMVCSMQVGGHAERG